MILFTLLTAHILPHIVQESACAGDDSSRYLRAFSGSMASANIPSQSRLRLAALMQVMEQDQELKLKPVEPFIKDLARLLQTFADFSVTFCVGFDMVAQQPDDAVAA